MGGNDEYKNLVILDKEVHVLIHATKIETINDLVCKLKLNKENIIKLNNEFKRIKNIGLVKSMRKGPTGIGYTFETLINDNKQQPIEHPSW